MYVTMDLVVQQPDGTERKVAASSLPPPPLAVGGARVAGGGGASLLSLSLPAVFQGVPGPSPSLRVAPLCCWFSPPPSPRRSRRTREGGLVLSCCPLPLFALLALPLDSLRGLVCCQRSPLRWVACLSFGVWGCSGCAWGAPPLLLVLSFACFCCLLVLSWTLSSLVFVVVFPLFL